MMNVDELEVEIKKGKEALISLEALYEKEEDEKKVQKLEFKMCAKEEAVNKLIERQQKLLDKEALEAEKDAGKDKNEEEEDLDVCPECGADLVLVGKDDNGVDIYECEKCKELYLDN
jgi:Zn-finger nucleic acid-binding protein